MWHKTLPFLSNGSCSTKSTYYSSKIYKQKTLLPLFHLGGESVLKPFLTLQNMKVFLNNVHNELTSSSDKKFELIVIY